MAEHLPFEPTESVGIVAVVTMVGFCILMAWFLLRVWGEPALEEEYLRCVAGIPTYLDGQEIAYLEQECRLGVTP